MILTSLQDPRQVGPVFGHNRPFQTEAEENLFFLQSNINYYSSVFHWQLANGNFTRAKKAGARVEYFSFQLFLLEVEELKTEDILSTLSVGKGDALS